MSRRWTWVGALLVLAGCPTVEEVRWSVAPDGTATVRLHDIGTDEDQADDWLAVGAGFAWMVKEGHAVIGPEGLRYQQVGDALDAVVELALTPEGLDELYATHAGVRLWCPVEPILSHNGVDLTGTLGRSCVAWTDPEQTIELVLGSAVGPRRSALEDWVAAGSPASVDLTGTEP